MILGFITFMYGIGGLLQLWGMNSWAVWTLILFMIIESALEADIL